MVGLQGIIAYLASDLSLYVTGQNFIIDEIGRASCRERV